MSHLRCICTTTVETSLYWQIYGSVLPVVAFRDLLGRVLFVVANLHAIATLIVRAHSGVKTWPKVTFGDETSPEVGQATSGMLLCHNLYIVKQATSVRTRTSGRLTISFAEPRPGFHSLSVITLDRARFFSHCCIVFDIT